MRHTLVCVQNTNLRNHQNRLAGRQSVRHCQLAACGVGGGGRDDRKLWEPGDGGDAVAGRLDVSLGSGARAKINCEECE